MKVIFNKTFSFTEQEIKEENTTVGTYRDDEGGLIFFRPIALYPFAKASVRIKENYNKSYV